MPVNLTEPGIRAAIVRAGEIGKQIDLSDESLPGLRFRANPGGTATWNLNCRDQSGRMRRFSIGSFPAISIAEARKRARKLRDEVKQNGADPTADRRRKRLRAKDAAAGIGTLAALLDSYAKQRGLALKSWADGRRQIENVFGPFLKRSLESLTKADLQNHADNWKSKQAASAAVRYLRPILKWAAERELLAASVAALTQPASTVTRRRVLSDDELERLLPALRASARPQAAAMLFALFTLARRDEIASACWRHIDFEAQVWLIPETKAGRPHRVPLSRQALALLEGRRPDTEKPEAKIFASGTGGKLDNWHRITAELQKASETSDWHRHDLRRTSATLMGDMGVAPHVIEAALNHAELHSALAGTYNRARYQPQVADALQKLADRLEGIETKAAKVVPMKRA